MLRSRGQVQLCTDGLLHKRQTSRSDSTCAVQAPCGCPLECPLNLKALLLAWKAKPTPLVDSSIAQWPDIGVVSDTARRIRCSNSCTKEHGATQELCQPLLSSCMCFRAACQRCSRVHNTHPMGGGSTLLQDALRFQAAAPRVKPVVVVSSVPTAQFFVARCTTSRSVLHNSESCCATWPAALQTPSPWQRWC